MSANHPFERQNQCAAQKEQVVRDAEQMVKWAAEPVVPGELVKAQIRNASENLQLDFGTVRRAWYRLSGPEIYPTIYNAWAALIERRSVQLRASPWAATPHSPAPGRPLAVASGQEHPRDCEAPKPRKRSQAL